MQGAGVVPRGAVAAAHGARRGVEDASRTRRADRRQDQHWEKEKGNKMEDVFRDKHSASLWERFSRSHPTCPFLEGVPVLLQRYDLAGRENFGIISLYMKFILKAISFYQMSQSPHTCGRVQEDRAGNFVYVKNIEI